MDSLSDFRKQFQPVLEGFLREKREEMDALVADPFLRDILHYPETLLAEGKRIRPYVAWLLYLGTTHPPTPFRLRWAGHAPRTTDDSEILRILTSLELFHAFALVHDDIMDRADTRRSVATVHRFVAERLAKDGRPQDADHAGKSQAILVGDLLMNWSQACVGAGSPDVTNARNVFRKMIDEVIIGQMIDVDTATREEVSDELIRVKLQLKTASYTFVRPMQMGAALAGSSDPKLYQWCERFGTPLGIAFQVQDDLLDLTQPSSVTGKPVFGDLGERQHTVFTQHILKHGSDDQKRELASLFGADLSEQDRPRVTALFEGSGALAAGIAEMNRRFDEARTCLDDAPVSDEATAAFRELVEGLRGRRG